MQNVPRKGDRTIFQGNCLVSQVPFYVSFFHSFNICKLADFIIIRKIKIDKILKNWIFLTASNKSPLLILKGFYLNIAWKLMKNCFYNDNKATPWQVRRPGASICCACLRRVAKGLQPAAGGWLWPQMPRIWKLPTSAKFRYYFSWLS